MRVVGARLNLKADAVTFGSVGSVVEGVKMLLRLFGDH